jgi:O-antigen/teichoic acid export membrane protein
VSLARKVALNASALTAGRMVNAVLGLVAVGISTRYLGVDVYGALVVALAYSGIVSALTDVGVWTIGAREIAKRPEDTHRLVRALVTTGLLVTLVGGAIAVGLAFALYPGEGNELERRGILLMLLGLPLAAPVGAASAYFIARQQAYIGTVGSVAQSVIVLGALLVVVAVDGGFTGVVLGYLIGGVCQALIMLGFSIGKVRLIPSRDLALSRDILRAALPLGGALLLNAAYWRLDLILLSLLVVKSEVALYGLAYKVVDFLTVLPAYVTVTLLPAFAQLASRRQEFDRIMQRAFSVMYVGAMAVLVFFVVFAEEVVTLAGGDDFQGATSLLQILAVGVALSYLAGVIGQGLIGLDRQADLLKNTAFYVLPVNIAANVALIPLLGNHGAALAFVVSEVVAVATLMQRYSRVATPPRLQAPLRVALAGCGMAAVAALKLVPGVDDAPPLAVLVGGGLLSTSLYVGSLYALGAMPREVHLNFLAPAWTRLRPIGRAAR